MSNEKTPLTRHEAIRLVELGYRDQDKCCPDAEIISCVLPVLCDVPDARPHLRREP